jgi:hypothetical protein
LLCRDGLSGGSIVLANDPGERQNAKGDQKQHGQDDASKGEDTLALTRLKGTKGRS